MNLKEFFKQVVALLKKERVRFALAGGLVSSIYRAEERLTKDLDFVILSVSDTEKTAIRIIRSLKLEPTLIRKADLEGGPLFAIKRGRSKPYIVAGRGGKDSIGLDFILPAMPWFEPALTRAEQNNIDFGFDKVPCLTVEDLIVAKFFALKNDQTRFNDLDDLKSIFLAGHELDLPYLSGQMRKFELTVPKPLKNMAPKALR